MVFNSAFHIHGHEKAEMQTLPVIRDCLVLSACNPLSPPYWGCETGAMMHTSTLLPDKK